MTTTVDTHRIVTGTGTSQGEHKYRWARLDCWKVRYWPDGGGAQAFIDLDAPIGFVVDVHDEMPHEVWIELLRAVGAPLDRMA